ncbi:protein FAM161B isoform X2 [Kryptolebias marmoratus]|nr:protein FAM161B isoform X2 [Kryptolebias marmoratus]
MSKCDTLLEDGLQSEILLQLHLQTMRKALRQQLQETNRRQTEELDKRVYQNSLLSTNAEEKELNRKPMSVGMRRSTSVSALTSDNEASSKQRPKARSPNPQGRSSVAQPCERFALSKTTQQLREEEDEAECRKKFYAVPVPVRVVRPIYQEMMERREKERKQGCERRRLVLLSAQRPFSFQEREKNKTETLIQTKNQVPKKNICVTKTHKHIKDSAKLKVFTDQEEVRRKANSQTKTLQENPPQTQGPRICSANPTGQQKLGFLNEKPSFQPKILRKVPNFVRLHRALQTEALDKPQRKDATKCQPFFLRTSALPARKSVESPETSQVPKVSRTRSLGALTLIPADTLPTYITDAVRQRCAAVRKSMESRESKNQEAADWLRSYQMRSQAMTKAVAFHAKLLDPHSSLRDVQNENLKRHREVDQQRMREYRRELQDMKARVSERPYLFEQVKQRNEKARAEQTYRSKLQSAGLQEKFVEETGGSFRSDDDAETNDSSTEDERQSREENVDDGEKIEDVEEKSVKSRGEEMP